MAIDRLLIGDRKVEKTQMKESFGRRERGAPVASFTTICLKFRNRRFQGYTNILKRKKSNLWD